LQLFAGKGKFIFSIVAQLVSHFEARKKEISVLPIEDTLFCGLFKSLVERSRHCINMKHLSKFLIKPKLFIRKAPWSIPHCGHRNGLTIDLSINQLDSDEKTWLSKAATSAGFTFTNPLEAPNNKNANHWHAVLGAFQ
jgi:hypothetical protein